MIHCINLHKDVTENKSYPLQVTSKVFCFCKIQTSSTRGKINIAFDLMNHCHQPWILCPFYCQIRMDTNPVVCDDVVNVLICSHQLQLVDKVSSEERQFSIHQRIQTALACFLAMSG